MVQKFHANANPDKPLPAVSAGLVDGARKPQAPQAYLRAMPVGSTIEKVKTRGDAGVILQDIDMPFSGSSQMSLTKPLYESWSGVAGAKERSSTTHEKRKQILESGSGEEEDDPADPDFDKQEFEKRRRTSELDEVVAKPNSTIQRAVVPCGQCILDEIECFKFTKLPRGRIRRACAHCKEKKRRCSFVPRPSRKNKEPSWKTLYAVADHDADEIHFSCFPSECDSTTNDIRVTNSDVNLKGGSSSSSHVKQESSLGDVTTRVIKVEDMVMDLQDQFKTIQEKVVVMDTRIEDLFEGTKSVARVMKGFETRSEQANRIIEKLVERVERVERL